MSERWHVRGRAIPGGEPVEWWVIDGALSAAPVAGAQPLPGCWIAPGLVDAHVHASFETHDRFGLERGSPELVAAHLGAQRAAGVLAVRDLGSLPSVERGVLAADGVDVVGCGPFLAPPGGFLPHLFELTPAGDAPAAAAARIRAGWPWAKVILDFPSDGNALAPRLGYPREVLTEIAAAVHEAGGRLAVHVMGDHVADAVAAGADSIEHGELADPDLLREMAARDIAWVPTMGTVVRYMEPIADQVPPARAMLDRARALLPLAAELGVRVLAGTDEEPHGSIAGEVATLVRYGLPARVAVAGATTAARAALGLRCFEVGAPARIVTFDADPVRDVSVLARPRCVVSGDVRVL